MINLHSCCDLRELNYESWDGEDDRVPTTMGFKSSDLFFILFLIEIFGVIILIQFNGWDLVYVDSHLVLTNIPDITFWGWVLCHHLMLVL